MKKCDFLAKKTYKKHAKGIVFLCALGVLFCAAFLHCDVCYASSDSQEEVEQELNEVSQSVLESLELDKLNELIRSLGAEGSQLIAFDDIGEAIRGLLSGESSDFFETVWGVLLGYAGRYFLSFIPSFVTIILLCLLKSILSSLTSDFLSGSTSELVHMVCYIAVVIVLASGIMVVVKDVLGVIDTLTSFAEIVFPLLLGLLSSMGAVSQVGGYSPLSAALSTLIMKIVSDAIVPCFIACIVLCVVSGVSKSVKLDKLTRLIRSASTWLIGVVFGLFASFLALQGVSGGVSDKLGFGVAKFAISSYVPILGGYLSDGFDIMTASVVLVKNALGYTGALVLCAIVIFPIIKVVIFSLSLRLTAAIAEPIGDDRVASLLTDAAKNTNLLVTALAGVAFLFFLLLMLIIGTCNFGV